MTSTLLIAMMIVLYACQTLFCRLYNQRYPGEESTSPFVYNVIYGVFVSIVTFAVGKGRFAPSTVTVLLGLLNGAVLFGYNLSLIKATASGSYAVANLCLLAGGILIPLFQSVIVYHVPLNALQYAGVAVMLAAFLFLNLDGIVGGRKEKKAKTAASRLFPLFCALLFLFNGLYGALLNAQQEATGNMQREEMIIVTFLFTKLTILYEDEQVMLLSKRGRDSFAAFRQTKSSALCMLLCCVSAAAALNLLMYVMQLVNVPVLYTVENGGVLVLSVVFAVFLFKEKITPFKAVGLLLALSSLVMLSVQA